MNDSAKITIQELEGRYRDALLVSEASVRTRPDAYRELKRVLREINSRVLDVSEYYPMADRLAGLLRMMIRQGDRTIFDYFIQNIDPCRGGNVRHFRSSCLDLESQLNRFDQWRAERHHLKRIK